MGRGRWKDADLQQALGEGQEAVVGGGSNAGQVWRARLLQEQQGSLRPMPQLVCQTQHFGHIAGVIPHLRMDIRNASKV